MLRDKNWLHWGLVLAWMGLIFSFSAQQGSDSGALSGSIVSSILAFWHTLFPSLYLDADTVHFLIRKGAHFSVYLVLGTLVANALQQSGMKKPQRAYATAILICFLYAMSDEIHQAFVPNRGPSFRDVLLDTAGASVGSMLYWKLRHHKRYSSAL